MFCSAAVSYFLFFPPTPLFAECKEIVTKRMAGGLFGADICAAILLAACLLYRWRRHYEDVFVCIVASFYTVLQIRIQIRCFFDPGIRDGKNYSWSGIRNKHPGSYFQEQQLGGVKITEISCCGSGPGFRCRFDPGFEMEKLGTGIKISGSGPHFPRPDGRNVKCLPTSFPCHSFLQEYAGLLWGGGGASQIQHWTIRPVALLSCLILCLEWRKPSFGKKTVLWISYLACGYGSTLPKQLDLEIFRRKLQMTEVPPPTMVLRGRGKV